MIESGCEHTAGKQGGRLLQERTPVGHVLNFNRENYKEDKGAPHPELSGKSGNKRRDQDSILFLMY